MSVRIDGDQEDGGAAVGAESPKANEVKAVMASWDVDGWVGCGGNSRKRVARRVLRVAWQRRHRWKCQASVMLPGRVVRVGQDFGVGAAVAPNWWISEAGASQAFAEDLRDGSTPRLRPVTRLRFRSGVSAD